MAVGSLLWIAPSQATVRQGHPQVEMLTGEVVRLRARQLLRKDAIVRAVKEMEKRGFRPAFRQGVILLVKGVQKRVSLGNQTFEELAFRPWDDGDDSTWQGCTVQSFDLLLSTLAPLPQRCESNPFC